MDFFTDANQTVFWIAVGLLFVLAVIPALVLTNQRQRKKVEQDLTRTHDRYRKIFNAAAVALLEHDCSTVKQEADQLAAREQGNVSAYLDAHPEHVREVFSACRITDANPAALRLFGAPSRQALIDAFAGLFLPETQTALRDVLVAMSTGQTHFESETAFRTLDNRTLPVLLSLTLPENPEAYRNLIISLADLTASRRSQEALCRSEDRFRTVFNHAACGMALLDLDGNYLRVNQALCTMLGYSEHQLSQMNWSDVTHPEDIPAALDATARTLEGQTLAPIENRLIDRQGQIVWALLSLARITGDDDEPLYCIAQLQDISTLRSAREKLRQREERYRQIFEADLSGFYIANPKGLLLMCNHVFARILGYDRAADLQGKNFKTFYKDQAVRYQITAELIQTRKVIHREVEFIKRDGSPIHVLINAIGRFNDQGLLLEIQGYLMDVTHQKNLEAQLLHAQKMESVGTMAGGIAHDFNNLLMGIVGNASLLQNELDRHHPAYSRLKSIEQYAQSGSSLTRQLLGFAKGSTYEVRPTDLNHLIRRNIQMFARTHKEIRVETDLAEALRPVEADQSQIDQVLYNLYVNAWQAMEKGGDLRIKTRNIVLDRKSVEPHGRQPGPYVQISVADTGIGISAEIQQRIFDPFFTTKERSRGTGLGLASAYGIIKNHGGFISVDSREGIGTTFTICLPASGEARPEHQPALPENEAPAAVGTGTLLLVDDEDVIIEAVGDMLRHMGYQLFTASNGDEALDIFNAHRDDIDLVILDLVMPGMSGAEVFEQLIAIDPRAKVLLCSGFSVEGQAAMLLQRGCLGFIQKPFTMSQLSLKLTEILQAQPA
ncbi:MAG: PAS domain S-box protein [Desulfosarcinaceae bacterium]